MAHSIYDNLCDVWEVNEKRIEDDSLETCIFSIDIHASFTYPNYDSLDDDEEEDEDEFDIEYFDSVTTQRTHMLQLDHMNRNAIRDMLVSMHIPVEEFMVARIWDCAASMLSKDAYKNWKVLRMRARIDVAVDELPFPIDKPTAVSKAAMETLEKVVVENLGIACAICLDEHPIGSEAKRMPCSHLFHGHCIVHWLEKSNFCPVCRFEMPS